MSAPTDDLEAQQRGIDRVLADIERVQLRFDRMLARSLATFAPSSTPELQVILAQRTPDSLARLYRCLVAVEESAQHNNLFAAAWAAAVYEMMLPRAVTL